MEINIALPNKGRLYEPAVRAVQRAGFLILDRDERLLIARTSDPEVKAVFIRASDIPKFVEQGAAELGITGHDLVLDSDAEVDELLDLRFGVAQIVLAAPESSTIKSVDDIEDGTRIATKFAHLAKSYFEGKKKKVEIVKVSGAAEVMPYLGMATLIVDVTSTGTTLQTHGLRVLDTILETSVQLIANKEIPEEKKTKIQEVTLAFKSVLYAQRKKLLMMNVPEEALATVTKIIPAMTGPTVAKVEGPVPMWEVYSVVDEEEVYRVVNSVKKAGARDILVIPIERIVP